MQSTNLVSGKKEELLFQFKTLRAIHGAKWRGLLRKHNPWHDSTTGVNAWENATKGSVGNETLRRIIADMQAIAASTRTKKAIQKQGLTRRIKA